VSSDVSPLNTLGSFIWLFFVSYLRQGVRPCTELLYTVEPSGGSGGNPPRPCLLGLSLLSDELELLCRSFPVGNGGTGGSSELPTQLLMPLLPPSPPPPPLEKPSPPLPAILVGGVYGGEKMSSAFLPLMISHFPLF